MNAVGKLAGALVAATIVGLVTFVAALRAEDRMQAENRAAARWVDQ